MGGGVDTLSRIKIKPKVKLTKVQSRSDEYEIIPTGHHIHIYIYSSLFEPSTGSQWGYMGLYKMNRGTARPINDYITLPKGDYDLYALSILNPRENIIPDISATPGSSKDVHNGKRIF